MFGENRREHRRHVLDDQNGDAQARPDRGDHAVERLGTASRAAD
jgi:hypothetical protein